MLGFNDLPNKIDTNTYLFYANASGSVSGSFQAWNVPEYAAFLHFTVIGGGGGGAGGCGGAGLTVGRSGGGGGAPGGIVAVSIPTILLPKTLYLQVGYGGAPGTGSNNNAIAGQSGQGGTISYVCLYPEINPGSVLIQSSNTAPGGGSGGVSVSGATGTAITIADVLNLKWLGIVGNTVAQLGGGTGGVGGNGASVTYTGLLTGGAGGGGKPDSSNNGSNGGSVTMANINAYITTAINGGAAGVNPAAGSNGSNGYFSWKPFISTGGAGGGGGSISANGGNGGKGGFGCGGGGGGAAGVIGGTGGPGGDGLIIIAVS
jgi:hypothetical protein